VGRTGESLPGALAGQEECVCTHLRVRLAALGWDGDDRGGWAETVAVLCESE
jgi:hypothetical protein